jgi:hypothetical protein
MTIMHEFCDGTSGFFVDHAVPGADPSIFTLAFRSIIFQNETAIGNVIQLVL